MKDQGTGNAEIEFLSSPGSCSMADEWFSYATADNFWMEWRFEVLKKFLNSYEFSGSTLDIGCGNGTARTQIESRYGCEITGCDLNLSALNSCPSGKGPLLCYDIYDRNEGLKEKFSTVLLLDVLEHIQDPNRFLEAVRFHLKQNGDLVVNVPAFQSFYSRYDKLAGHVKRYTIPSLSKELKVAGFDQYKAHYWGMSLLPFLMLRKFVVRACREEDVIRVGFEPGFQSADRLLNLVRRLENFFLPSAPIGSSLFAVARKAD